MHTITFETRAHCPDQIRGGRNPWTGTVQELIGFSEPAIQGEVVHEMLTRGTITQGQYDAADGYIGDLIEFLTIEDLRSLADDPNLTRTNTKTAPYPGISQPGTGRCLCPWRRRRGRVSGNWDPPLVYKVFRALTQGADRN